MSDHSCPMCHDGILEHVQGRLDQSGDSYLPTDVWRCPRCEYARFEPALRVRWRPGTEQLEEEPVDTAASTTRHAA